LAYWLTRYEAPPRHERELGSDDEQPAAAHL
jgi:hypothetical protein